MLDPKRLFPDPDNLKGIPDPDLDPTLHVYPDPTPHPGQNQTFYQLKGNFLLEIIRSVKQWDCGSFFTNF